MPTLNLRKHRIPAAGEATFTREVIFQQFGLSINDFIPVANVTERGQVITALNTATPPAGPTAERPIAFARADAPGLHRMEYTYDGVVFIPFDGVMRFPTRDAADAFGTANAGMLTTDDRCVAGGQNLRWSIDRWVPLWPAVRVFRSGLHSSGSPFRTNGGTFRLNWDAEAEDPADFHSAGLNPDRLTVPPGMGGVYAFDGKTRVEDNGADECLFFLDKNGVKVDSTETALQGGYYKRGLIAGEIRLNPNDWVAFCVNKPGDPANLTPAQSVFGMRWVRP
ncbi:hypothetical protein [Microbacterium thalli]|uniref:Uncharacterized protein n=1 Tax=Microbacterium thalli TaxID=3027921 RepID=A0ABT5SKE7_9MICO|nr:hypothetical protein [Microbacterium thalli]MDD7963300.1 hypothetical protein [Microbacterium thalli]